MKSRILIAAGVLLAAMPALAQDNGSTREDFHPNPHMFGIFPNHATVEDEPDAPPVGTRQKFAMAAETHSTPGYFRSSGSSRP